MHILTCYGRKLPIYFYSLHRRSFWPLILIFLLHCNSNKPDLGENKTTKDGVFRVVESYFDDTKTVFIYNENLLIQKLEFEKPEEDSTDESDEKESDEETENTGIDVLLYTPEIESFKRTYEQATHPDAKKFNIQTRYRVYKYDEKDNPVLSISYQSPGDDETWGTSDDEIYGYEKKVYNSSGSLSETINGEGPGPDDLWFTKDDISTKDVIVYNKYGNILLRYYYNSSGPDGFWNTNDDIINFVKTPRRYEQALTMEASSTHPGPDGIWMSSDDTLQDDYYWAEQVNFRDKLQIYYEYKGKDELWFTEDDVPGRYRRVISYRNGDNRVIFYDDSGPDMIWKNEDDTIYGYTDEKGTYREGMRIAYNSPGVDQIWFTSDDLISDYTTNKEDAKTLEHTSINYENPGDDNEWFTSDDVIDSYYKDKNYSEKIFEYFFIIDHPGEDEIWLTGDDHVSFYYFNLIEEVY
ncbi:MAG: hypothetical protein ABUK01_15785 [Leptospirales bacterium]